MLGNNYNVGDKMKTKSEIEQKIEQLSEKQRISETHDEMEYYDGAIDFLIWVLDKKVIK